MSRKPITHDMAAAYVYAITVDGVVRYVGKGRRYRLREHTRIARFLNSGREAGKRIRTNRFYNRLAAAIRSGADIGEIVFADGLSDEDAFQLEKERIASFPIGAIVECRRGRRRSYVSNRAGGMD